MVESKHRLRQNIKSYWQELDTQTRLVMENNLYQQIFTDEMFSQANTLAITLSMAGEISTQPIIEEAWRQGKQVVIPKTLPKRQMAFAPFEKDDDLLESAFGVMEPRSTANFVDKEDIDLIVVPGLMFADNGQRLGFGGGYYDRFLADFPGQTLSLAFPKMYVEKPLWEVGPYDIPVQKLIVAK